MIENEEAQNPEEVEEQEPEVEGPEEEETEPEATSQTEPQTTTQTEAPQAEINPKPLSDEFKVIIIMKADSLLLGVQSPDCDPVYKTFKGTMADALQQTPALIEEAKQKWATNPRYPKANLPEPPPAPPTRAAAPRAPAPPKETKPKTQPSFF